MFSATATTMMTASRCAAVAACVRADSVCARTVDTTVAAASRAMSTSDRRTDTSRSLGIIV